MKVNFKQWDCTALFFIYQAGRVRIDLHDSTTGEPVATATVNIPECPLKPGQTLIKDYEENEGMLAALVAANMVRPTGQTVPCGHAVAHVCEMLVGGDGNPIESERQQLESIWVFVGLDPVSGHEGITACMTPNGLTPLVMVSDKHLASAKAMAQDMANDRGITMRLVQFTGRIDLETITPNDPKNPQFATQA